jgi:hypothetical protein
MPTVLGDFGLGPTLTDCAWDAWRGGIYPFCYGAQSNQPHCPWRASLKGLPVGVREPRRKDLPIRSIKRVAPDTILSEQVAEDARLTATCNSPLECLFARCSRRASSYEGLELLEDRYDAAACEYR